MKCPACGTQNIEGTDRCDNCLHPFRDLDVPQPKGGIQAHLMLDPVRNLYSPNPAAVNLEDSITHAISIMQQWRAGCVNVMQGEKLVGILSEVDLLFKLAERDAAKVKVSELMTSNPETVQEDSTIADALHLMSIGGYRHLPVLREGSLVGILSIKDVLRYLKEKLL